MRFSMALMSSVCLLAFQSSAESADPQPTDAPSIANDARSETAVQPVKAAADAKQPSQDSASRQLQQQTWERAQQDARRPTEWQLQNPSGWQNRNPTSRELPGYVSPNNYFGPQYREWSQMSPPVSQSERPANMTPTTPLLQSNAPVAPLNYWGESNVRWNNITIPRPQPSPFGSWTIAPGW